MNNFIASIKTRARNKRLVKRYPFLLPRNVWTDELDDNYNYEYTWLDDMPDGWRKAFGEQMCEEIRKALVKHNYLEKYRISQIKEKFGSLRWYDFGAPSEVFDITEKYERQSRSVCIGCGKPATKVSTGWISPWCDNCTNTLSGCTEFEDIKEWFKNEF